MAVRACGQAQAPWAPVPPRLGTTSPRMDTRPPPVILGHGAGRFARRTSHHRPSLWVPRCVTSKLPRAPGRACGGQGSAHHGSTKSHEVMGQGDQAPERPLHKQMRRAAADPRLPRDWRLILTLRPSVGRRAPRGGGCNAGSLGSGPRLAAKGRLKPCTIAQSRSASTAPTVQMASHRGVSSRWVARIFELAGRRLRRFPRDECEVIKSGKGDTREVEVRRVEG